MVLVVVFIGAPSQILFSIKLSMSCRGYLICFHLFLCVISGLHTCGFFPAPHVFGAARTILCPVRCWDEAPPALGAELFTFAENDPVLQCWTVRQYRPAKPFADQRAGQHLRTWTWLTIVQQDAVAVNTVAAPTSDQSLDFGKL